MQIKVHSCYRKEKGEKITAGRAKRRGSERGANELQSAMLREKSFSKTGEGERFLKRVGGWWTLTLKGNQRNKLGPKAFIQGERMGPHAPLPTVLRKKTRQKGKKSKEKL